MIAQVSECFPVARVCRAVGVPRSSFYAGLKAADRPSKVLLDEVRQIHAQTRHSYGSRRMSQALRQRGHSVGRYRARSLMLEANVAVRGRRRPGYRRAEQASVIVPNRLDRQFQPAQRDQVWAGDIPYVPTARGWMYLAIVMDLYARRVVGWACAERADGDLVIEALNQAWESRRQPSGAVFHSDQGTQYTSAAFAMQLDRYGLVQSLSRRGNCWDNAVVERFFRSLKSEWIGRICYGDRATAERDIIDYIGFYNTERLHSTLGYQTPLHYEAAASPQPPLGVSRKT